MGLVKEDVEYDRNASLCIIRERLHVLRDDDDLCSWLILKIVLGKIQLSPSVGLYFKVIYLYRMAVTNSDGEWRYNMASCIQNLTRSRQGDGTTAGNIVL